MRSTPGFAGLAAVAVALVPLASPAATVQPASPVASTTEAERLEQIAAFERDGPSRDPAYLEALASLSLLYVNRGRYADAVPLLRRALAASERIHGPGHDVTREFRATLMLAERFDR